MSSPQEPESAMEEGEGEKEREVFHTKRHIKYFVRVLNVLPCALSSLDSNR